MNYRSDRAGKVITEIEEESKFNQSEVTKAMASVRQLIDQHESVLIEDIQRIEKVQRESIEKYKQQLQGEQQGLIEQIKTFMVVCQDKQPKKRKEAKIVFDDYIKKVDAKLLELKPQTKIKQHVVGLRQIMETEIKDQIQKIKIGKDPNDENEKQILQQRITSNPNKATLNLGSSQLKDLHMEIVALELKANRVSEHTFLLPLRLVRLHKVEGLSENITV